MGVEVNIRVELPSELAEHVALATGEEGDFASVEVYVRDLIRRDMEAIDLAVVESHREELQLAFAAPQGDFAAFDGEVFLQEMKRKHG